MKEVTKVTCPYCGAPAVLRQDDYVHGSRGQGKFLYVCKNYPACDSYVGVHEGTKIPLGTLANKTLRRKRIKAHRIFNLLWEKRLMTKKEAYRWMEYFMGLKKDDGHIAMFSDYRCEVLIDKCREVLVNNHIKLPAA